MSEHISEFIAALEALTRQHGVAIGGCGCCGSPWLQGCADLGDVTYRGSIYRGGYIASGDGDEGLQWLSGFDQCLRVHREEWQARHRQTACYGDLNTAQFGALILAGKVPDAPTPPAA